ncbi:DUF4272 domain-containing protein [Pseudomonas sp. EA_35y_Pfl2_R111]|uniref:DUF4272 domain-containing protein n=1 Tax=Pseudomonas sp. EA_35y_Pfl2_R111 TaxID=3088689 RepID=UPI0030D8E674
MLDLSLVKIESETYVLSQGGKTCDWLPSLGLEDISLRDSAKVAARALVLNIFVNIAFSAPIAIARKWLIENDLMDSLTLEERKIIEGEAEPNEETKNQLKWQIECLWAAAWAGGLASDLLPVQEISNSLASWLPSLRNNESASEFYGKFQLRSHDEIYKKLDLFYRSHWHARSSQLEGNDPAPFHPGVVQQRRHFLEWVLHREVSWDDVDLST